jgi:hypothetical protein
MGAMRLDHPSAFGTVSYMKPLVVRYRTELLRPSRESAFTLYWDIHQASLPRPHMGISESSS